MSATILIVDDEENARINIGTYLTSRGYEVIDAATLTEARTHIERSDADVILLDVNLPDGYGPVLLDEAALLPIRPPIILITAYGHIEKSITRAAEIVSLRRELAHLRSQRQDQLDFIVGKTTKMKTVMNHARRAAEASVSVLITGETGTGKEVLANSIHQMGPRAGKPFVAINCAAIQSTVLESELFGYEAGAFTGADKRKPGLMETADRGILFLDEISSMPLDMQAKLLRAIEEYAFRRVGGINVIRVDVQILAASNRDLPKMIAAGTFREDLYYRLKVVDLHLPPLRERKQDIPELVGLLIRKNNQRMGMNIEGVTPRAIQALQDHAWPGNIRELKNVIERAMLFCDESVLDLCHLPAELIEHPNSLD